MSVVELVAEDRCNNLRPAGAQALGRRADAAMVDDGERPREQ